MPPLARLLIMTVQAVGNQKVVRMFGKLAYFGKSRINAEKSEQAQRENLHGSECLKQVIVHVARCFHETLLSDAHGFHDREEKISEQGGCVGFFVAGDRMVSSMPIAATGKQNGQTTVVVRIGIAHAAAVKNCRRVQKGAILTVFLLTEKADKTGEVRYLLFAHLIEFGYFVRIISMMG